MWRNRTKWRKLREGGEEEGGREEGDGEESGGGGGK